MLNEANLPVYRFDQADAELSLLPMAARRALDCAGLHLSLAGWQQLTLTERQALVRLGATDEVDQAQVAQLLAAHGANVRPTPPLTEAAAAGPGSELLEALPSGHGLGEERWRTLSALDRYVLSQLARRGKKARLAEAFAEICSG